TLPAPVGARPASTMAVGRLVPRFSMTSFRIPLPRALALAALAVLALAVASTQRAAATSIDSSVDDAAPVWSPDGTKIAFSSRAGGHWQIYTVRANGGSRRALTSGGLDSIDVAWSPNGRQLAFSRLTDGVGKIYVVGADGAGAHELTPDTGDDDYWAVWSPDGKRIAFDRTGSSAFGDIWVMNADGSG